MTGQLKNVSNLDYEQADSAIILSFCIPTLNRANELRVSLESIVGQAIEGIEIVIVDGGSSDDTRNIIDSFRSRLTKIRVYESETKSGVDRDILQSVAMARGRYCWLFSDDDFLMDGALEKILNIIDSNPQVCGISANYVAYDSNLKYKIATAPAIANSRIEETKAFFNREECFAHLGVHLGFISCQVINRDNWISIVGKEDLSSQCNGWIIIYMIGKMLELNPSWYYLHDACIGYRSGNDSFIARLGVMKRQEITHIHFSQTIGSLFPKGSECYRSVIRILLQDRMPRTLALLKSKGLPISTQILLFKMYFHEYRSYSSFWFLVLPVFFVPNLLMTAVRKIYFKWRKWLSS